MTRETQSFQRRVQLITPVLIAESGTQKGRGSKAHPLVLEPGGRFFAVIFQRTLDHTQEGIGHQILVTPLQFVLIFQRQEAGQRFEHGSG